MECDERSALILLRELIAAVEHEVHRRTVCGEGCHRGGELGTAAHLLAVAAVLGVEQKLLLSIVEEAIWPAEIRSLHRAIHRLGRALGVLLGREPVWPEDVELVAI